MNVGGILRPSKSPPTRNEARVLVLPENSGNGPTCAQIATINNLKKVNPLGAIFPFPARGGSGGQGNYQEIGTLIKYCLQPPSPPPAGLAHWPALFPQRRVFSVKTLITRVLL